MKKVKIKGRTHYLLNCDVCDAEIKRIKSTIKEKNYCRKCASKINIQKALEISTNQNTQNNNYFEDMSLQACYWAGFIAADGYISNKTGKVEISIADKGHLLKFKEDAEATNKIESVTLNRGYKVAAVQERIRICNRIWLADLEKIFNIQNAKSLTHEPPDTSSWSIEQTKAFIVGYIDGDGCITGFDKGDGQLNICGTTQFLTFLKQFFEEEYKVTLSEKCIRATKTIYRLFLYTSKARKVLKDLKQLPIYKLERKWSKI